MSGAQGNALDWALALAKAPSERHALRQRALPEEIDILMQIAGGGAGDTLARAAARTGESPRSIVEASRFYLREVLFFPEADAYRLLGVANDAEHGRIRSHHRLLQQWLHPDRGSEEDAAFAARVNAAWDQVRQPDRRAAYDLSHPASLDPVTAGDAIFPLRPWIPGSLPETVQIPAEERWRRRVPLVILLAACIGLGVITVQYQQRLDAVGSLPLAGSMQDHAPLLRMPRRVTDAPAVVAARRDRPAARPVTDVTQASVAISDDMTGDDPVQFLTIGADPEFAIPPGPEDVPAIVAAAPPIRRSPANVQERTSMAMMPTPAAIPVPTPPPARAQPQRVPVNVPAPQAEALEPVVTANANSIVSAADATAPGVPAPLRVVGAQQVGERLLAYLVQSGRGVPPIWDSVSAERAATQIRSSIARGQGPRFETPTWRIAHADAALQASLRFHDGREGRLRARLTWREQRWLVSDLSMEQDW